MANKSPIAAARFGISIDGVQIASFSELQGITTKVDVVPKSQGLLTHELTHVIQQNVGKRGVRVRLSKIDDSDFSSKFRLQKSAGRIIKLTAYNKSGTPVAAISGRASKVDKDVMQQEWEIVYETIQRVI